MYTYTSMFTSIPCMLTCRSMFFDKKNIEWKIMSENFSCREMLFKHHEGEFVSQIYTAFWETLIFQLPRTCDSGDVFEKVMINHVLPPRWSFSASSFKKLLVARQIQLWLHKESVCWCGRKTTGKIRLRTATTEGKSRQESSFERRNFSPCFSSSLSKVHKLFQR